MREKLKEYVSLLFAGSEGTEDMAQEILQNTLDRYDDLIARGFSEEDAYRQAVVGIGDVDALLGRHTAKESSAVYPSVGKRICTAVAVALYILCLIPLVLFQNELGLCCLLGMVACGVMIQVLAGKLMDNLEARDSLSPGMHAGLTACAIALYILSPVPLFLFESEIGLCCLLCMVAVGVAMQIIVGKGPLNQDAAPRAAQKNIRTLSKGIPGIVISLVICAMLVGFWAKRYSEKQLSSLAPSVPEASVPTTNSSTTSSPSAGSVNTDETVYTADGSQSFDASEVQALKIDWVSGSVSLKYDSGSTLRCSVSGADDTVYKLKNGTLSVSVPEHGGFRFSGSADADLTILLPSGWTAREVEVGTVSAPVQINGLKTSELDIETTSGAMTLSDIQADEAGLSSVSADITYSGSARKIEAETTSGSCELNLEEAPNKIELEAVSGSFKLFLPKSAGFTLELETISGNFHTNFDCTSPKSGRYVSGSGSCAIHVETVSGSIDVRQK